MNHKEEKPLALAQKQQKEIVRQYELLLQDPLTDREHSDEEYSSRNPFQRDYSRILYSPSFRRLQGKMQIVGIKSSSFFRNRLTHSLEVSQIATSIARLLSISCNPELFSVYKVRMYDDDIHLIEAAALAHDIGHPAFGHKGERVLNELGKAHDIRFEGNAHNFRILRKLEKKEPKVSGLNLTPRTLLAINKYMVKEDKETKKFMFAEDHIYLQDIRNKVEGLEKTRTLDVQIIELADDIAYAVHDLEDGLMLRNFTIDEILFGLQKKSLEAYDLFLKFVDEAKNYSQDEKVKNVQEFSKIFRMSLTSQLTHTFINDITIDKVDPEEAKTHGTPTDVMELTLGKYKSLLNNLKDVVFECTTRRNDVRLYELRGEIVLKNLYYIYTNLDTNLDGMLMPPYFRPERLLKDIKKEDKEGFKEYHHELAQNAIDYIAGMMDTFAIEEFERLTHKKFNEINLEDLDEINRKLEGRKRDNDKALPSK